MGYHRIRKKKLILIGLVDLETSHGDAQHFNSLITHLSLTFDVYSITLGGYDIKNNYSIKFPKNRFFRQLYWNVYISFLIIRLWFLVRPDMLYIRPMGAVIAPFFICRILKLKVGIEINGILIEGYQNKPILHKYLKNRYLNIFKSVQMVAASKGYAQLMKKQYNIDDKKLVYLTLGYHPLKNKLCPYDSRERLGLNHDTKYLLFIGNINRYQGLQYIIMTIINYVDQFKSMGYALLIVGDGEYMDELKREVENNNLSDLVFFIGRVNKNIVHYYLSIGAIGLSPFDYKRGEVGSISGLKTFDYLFHKMPILTSKMDDLSNLILANGFGEVLYEYSKEEVWRKINLLFEKDKYQEIKLNYEQKYEWIVENFSWEKRFSKISNKMFKVLES